MSADIMASLCDVRIHVGLHAFSLERYLSRMKNCSKHADPFIRQFLRAVKNEGPYQSGIISTLHDNFLIDYYRDLSLI